jgi:hypothetical protein
MATATVATDSDHRDDSGVERFRLMRTIELFIEKCI